MKFLLQITRKLITRNYLFYNKLNCHVIHQRYCTTAAAETELPLAAGYQPRQVEQAFWEREANKDESVKNLPLKGKCNRGTYRMLLPPPNVTGSLHLGHALNATIQDVIARQHNQLGYDVEWIPGTDHAGIATQVVVEKKLLREKGLKRQEIGREEFLKEVWQWKKEKGDSIISDLKNLGCILSWDKEYFTMDDRLAHAVNTAFIKLFDDGTIIRKNSLVNWSCALQSAISDIEVETVQLDGCREVVVPGYKHNVLFGRIYDVAYKIVNDDPNAPQEEIVVSTTRPETILGDVAVAVHPLDERYMKYRNLQDVHLKHPFRETTIPLIFDLSVDREFGTGAVKITPAHDRKDFEIATSHQLDPIKVFTDSGHILETFPEFKGQLRFDARNAIVNRLEELQLLRHVRAHPMSLPICSRSRDVIEYMMMPQWFLQCQSLADAALSELHSGRLQIIPSNFEIEWERWLHNCRDWCVSRQLWWGHQVPAYLATNPAGKSVWVAAIDEQTAKLKAAEKLEVGSKDIVLKRDPDVLDTWFSSALLPFAAQGWPNESFRGHYPLDIMQTGHDILFFWVARMMMLGLKLAGEAPFYKVLLNGIVCDAHGRKMSKSLGNIVTPQQVVQGTSLEELKDELQKSYDIGILKHDELQISAKGLRKMFPNGIQECGTDALRFTLLSYNIKNHFINFDVTQCHTNKLFLNKIWQAERYTLGAAQHLGINIKEIESMNNVELGLWDRWIINRLAETLAICADSYNNYNLHMAAAALKHFFYQDLCDVYLETTKSNIKDKNNAGYVQCATLVTCLSWGLQAIAPYTPFVASELLQHLPNNVDIKLSAFQDSQLQSEVADIVEICENIRQLKSRNQISKKHDPSVCLFAQNQEAMTLLSRHTEQIKVLTMTKKVELELLNEESKFSRRLNFFSTAGPLCSFGITTNSKYANTPEQQKLLDEINKKKLKKLLNQVQSYRLRMDNEAFVLMASQQVQDHFATKIKELEAEIENLKRLV